MYRGQAVALASGRAEVARGGVGEPACEVADALARRGTMTAQLEAQTSLRDSARVGYRLSEARFRAGVDGFLATLDSQRTLYSAEQSLLATRLTRATNMVELYRAMGGGLQ